MLCFRKDKNLVYHPELLPVANIAEEIVSPVSGYIKHIECDEIGICSLILGGGRETKESEIDLSVGIILTKKVNDYVEQGDTIAYIHGNDPEKIAAAKERLKNAYAFSRNASKKPTMIKCIIQ